MDDNYHTLFLPCSLLMTSIFEMLLTIKEHTTCHLKVVTEGLNESLPYVFTTVVSFLPYADTKIKGISNICKNPFNPVGKISKKTV